MTDLPDAVRAILDGPSTHTSPPSFRMESPHSVPVWVGVEGRRLAVLTSPRSRKARNLSRDPRVSISMTDARQPNLMAQVRGRVCGRVEGDEAWRIIDRMSHKYIGQPYPLGEDRVVFLIEPESTWAQAF